MARVWACMWPQPQLRANRGSTLQERAPSPVSHLLGAHQVVCGHHLRGTEEGVPGGMAGPGAWSDAGCVATCLCHRGRTGEMSRTPSAPVERGSRRRLGRRLGPGREPVREEAQPRAHLCERPYRCQRRADQGSWAVPWARRSAPSSTGRLGECGPRAAPRSCGQAGQGPSVLPSGPWLCFPDPPSPHMAEAKPGWWLASRAWCPESGASARRHASTCRAEAQLLSG